MKTSFQCTLYAALARVCKVMQHDPAAIARPDGVTLQSMAFVPMYVTDVLQKHGFTCDK